MNRRYNTYVPFVRSSFDSKFGVGITYETPRVIKSIGYYYNWSAVKTDDRYYIPHAFRTFKISWMSKDYDGYVLLLNEPENKEQSNLSPEEAAKKVIAFHEDYPKAKLIVGGYGLFGIDQFDDFVSALGDYKPYGFHVHGYIEKSEYWNITMNDVISWWKYARRMCEGELWVTEFADTFDGKHIKDLLQYINDADWISRAFWFVAYTGAVHGRPWWMPEWWTFDPSLFNEDGSLTETGKIYKEYQLIHSQRRI